LDLRKLTYIGLLKEAHGFADKKDIESLIKIKEELVNRINSKQQKDKSPSWGSLMGYYEISTIIESIED
jgi:hypothetical protein|tara:strand:- start:6 stop:212 length:207 start_codon:yes stop_codon:yes gene_type:complete